MNRRDGQLQTVMATELVPGDLVRFSIGDRIPADCRLITVKHCSPLSFFISERSLERIQIASFFRQWI